MGQTDNTANMLSGMANTYLKVYFYFIYINLMLKQFFLETNVSKYGEWNFQINPTDC